MFTSSLRENGHPALSGNLQGLPESLLRTPRMRGYSGRTNRVNESAMSYL